MAIGIYIIHNTVTHTVYVGKTAISFDERKAKHWKMLKGNCHFNRHLQNAWNKYQSSDFEFDVLEDIQNEDNLSEAENFYLAYFRYIGVRLYNSKVLPNHNGFQRHSEESKAKIGNAFRGKPLTEEHRQKVAAARIGKRHTLETRQKIGILGKGRIVSAEKRAKISAFQKGRARTEEEKAQISIALQGHPVSEETRQKLREAHTGRKLPDSQIAKMNASADVRRKVYPGFVSPDGTIYRDVKGLRRFCREHGLSSSHMADMIAGKCRTCKGWRVLDEDDT